MKVTVSSCGHLGAVHAPSMAGVGHDVVRIDVDPPTIWTAAGRSYRSLGRRAG